MLKARLIMCNYKCTIGSHTNSDLSNLLFENRNFFTGPRMGLEIDDNYQTLYQRLNEHSLDGDPLDIAWYRFKLCADSGLLLHCVPSEFGGHEDSFLSMCSAFESLGFHVRDPGLIVSIHAHLWGCVFPIMMYGTEEQKQKYLPGLLNGETLGAYAFSEPQSWTKAVEMKATAVLDEKNKKQYVLNAHKRFIVNTPISQLQLVYACVDGMVTAFILDESDEGVELMDMVATEGFITASMGDLMVTDCRLDASRILGEIGEGKEMIRFTREMERVFMFAGLVGVLKWQLEEISVYVKSKKMSQQSLAKFQTVDHKISEMRVRLDTMRLWVNHCATLKDNQEQITLPSAEAKIYCSESYLKSTLEAMELVGAIGLASDDFLIQSILDAMASKFISGSVPYQKDIIAKHLGLG